MMMMRLLVLSLVLSCQEILAFSSSKSSRRRSTILAASIDQRQQQDQFNGTVADLADLAEEAPYLVLEEEEFVENMSFQMNDFLNLDGEEEEEAEDPFLKQLEETLLATIEVLEDTLQETQIVNELETREFKEQQSLLEQELKEQKSLTDQALEQLQMERFLAERMQQVPQSAVVVVSETEAESLLQEQQERHMLEMEQLKLALQQEQEQRKQAQAENEQLLLQASTTTTATAEAESTTITVNDDDKLLFQQQQQQELKAANQKIQQLNQDLSNSKTQWQAQVDTTKLEQQAEATKKEELQASLSRLKKDSQAVDIANTKNLSNLKQQLKLTQEQLQTSTQKAFDERLQAKQTAASKQQELTKTKRSLVETMVKVGRLETKLAKVQEKQQKLKEKQQQQLLLGRKKAAAAAAPVATKPSSSTGGGKKIGSTIPKPSIIMPPRLDNWELTPAGEVQGSVSNHPSLPNGEPIRTSLLVNPKLARDGATVKTRSGSSYKLGRAKRREAAVVKPAKDTTTTTSGMKNLFSGAGLPSYQPQPPQPSLTKEEESKETPSLNLFGNLNKKVAAPEDTTKEVTKPRSPIPGINLFKSKQKVTESEEKKEEELDPVAKVSSTPLPRIHFFGSGNSSPSKKDTKEEQEDESESTTSKQPYAALNIFGNHNNKPKLVEKAEAEPVEVKETAIPVPKKSYGDRTKQKGLQAPKTEPSKLELTGKSFCNGKYLLAGKAKKSVTGRCLILGAYQADGSSNPSGKPLVIKLSDNGKAMKKEHTIYKKVASGVNRGVIVKCHGYIPDVKERPGKSALILERGVRDLKEHRRWHGLNGDELKEALHSINQVMESFHGARMVWTDMKTENFVIVEDETSGESFVKAIDLESAMNVKENPIDYTPEATPPEFAKAFVSGDPHSFVLDFSFDVWSFGMLAYELASGVGYFDGNSPDAIMQKLSQNNIPNTSIGIENDDLADLISQCLSLDPKQRPSAQKISRHPYFSSVSKPALFQLW